MLVLVRQRAAQRCTANKSVTWLSLELYFSFIDQDAPEHLHVDNLKPTLMFTITIAYSISVELLQLASYTSPLPTSHSLFVWCCKAP